jgi:hypothetical protein
MASFYHRQEWFKFRERCLDRVGRKCEACGRGQGEASLQIHHPHYAEGVLPWDYKEAFCQVLCKGCHAKEHGLIKPSDGWILIHSDWEWGESSGSTCCENCGAAMDWHNDLWNPAWGIITVGYDCAEKLGNPEAHAMRKQHLRERTFLNSPRWNRTQKGWKYKHGDLDVFVLDRGEYCALNISGEWGRLKYKTLEDAKRRAFLYSSHKKIPHTL